VAAHAVAAGLTGGLQGALGAATSQLVIDAIGKQIAATDLPLSLKAALIAAAGTAIGAAVASLAGLSPEKRMAIGFALDPLSPAIGHLAGKVSIAFNKPIDSLETPTGRVTVYRVEGMENTRIAISENGSVVIIGDQMLFLNFGDKQRAMDFLAKRISQNMDSPAVKSFEVGRQFFEDLKASAVPEVAARRNPNLPIIVDETKAKNQLGLRKDQIDALRNAIIPESGRYGL